MSVLLIITLFLLAAASAFSFRNFVKDNLKIVWVGMGVTFLLRAGTSALIFFKAPFAATAWFLAFHRILLPFCMSVFILVFLYWYTRTQREREHVTDDLAESRKRAYTIFNYSDVSLTEEDVGLIRLELHSMFPDGTPEEKIIEYLYQNPQSVKHLASLVKILDVNERTLKLFEASSKAEMIMSYSATFTGKSYDTFIALAAALAAGKKSIKQETELLTLKGKKLSVLMKVSLPQSKEDSTVIVSIIDMTGQKNLQKEIEAERDRAQQYFDIVEVVMVIYDTRGIIKKINRKGRTLFGYTEAEVLGRNWFDTFILPENRGWLKKKFKNIMEGNLPYNSLYNEDLLKKDGDTVHVEWRAVPLYDEEGHLEANLCSGIDVTELKRRQDELEKSEQRFKAVEKLAKIGYWEADMIHGSYFWSDENYRIQGLEPGEVDPFPLIYQSHIHPDDIQTVREEFERSVREHRDYRYTYRLLIGNTVKNVTDWTQHFFDERGTHIYSAGLTQDITDQVTAARKLEKSLREKEALLRELHHRTKNNMQVISAMLNLRAGVENDLHISSVFLDMDNKIQSMARAHEKLYSSGDLSHINFKEYFEDLIELLKESFGTDRRNIFFTIQVDMMDVLIDIAVPCGLILNELVTNAIKYAFPGQRKGVIGVILKKEDERNVRFTVEDNGIGMDAGLKVEELDSLGIRTIMALGEGQLQGRVVWKTGKGVSCTVYFRNDTYTERI